jgi:hypothetical protein
MPLGAKVPLSILFRFVGLSLMFFLKTRLRGIRSKFIIGSALVHTDVSRAIYADFLPAALDQHRFAAAPEAQVVGSGLDSIQAALGLQRKGVSARKVVVTLP